MMERRKTSSKGFQWKRMASKRIHWEILMESFHHSQN